MRQVAKKILPDTSKEPSPEGGGGKGMNHVVNELPKLKAGNWLPVEPIHCHQRFPENALISRIRATSEDRILTELRCKFETKKLPFFYDHEIDHLPGMLEACALRQGSLVAAHLIYDVPMDWIALLDWMNLRLFNYGELNGQTVIRGKLLEASKTTHKVELVFDGLLVQNGYPVMNAKGKLVMFSPSLAKRVRHKKVSFEAIPDLTREYYGLQTINR